MSKTTVMGARICINCGLEKPIADFGKMRRCHVCFLEKRRTHARAERLAASRRPVLFFMQTEARFWSKVEKNVPPPAHAENLGPCWLWTGGKFANGYGVFTVDGMAKKAHRFSWVLSGQTLPVGAVVCHRCDVKTCVNPEHLFVGTARDNVHDCRSKGRLNRPKGERIGCSKLTEATVREIRALRGTGSFSAIGRRFGVARATIRAVLAGKTWKHVP